MQRTEQGDLFYEVALWFDSLFCVSRPNGCRLHKKGIECAQVSLGLQLYFSLESV